MDWFVHLIYNMHSLWTSNLIVKSYLRSFCARIYKNYETIQFVSFEKLCNVPTIAFSLFIFTQSKQDDLLFRKTKILRGHYLHAPPLSINTKIIEIGSLFIFLLQNKIYTLHSQYKAKLF